jgi:hypothetical protein
MDWKEVPEDQYPFLVNDVMEYIVHVKNNGEDLNLVEIITDYSFKYNIDVETIGDAISSDVYFKSFIEKDCELHKIFKTENTNEDW